MAFLPTSTWASPPNHTNTPSPPSSLSPAKTQLPFPPKRLRSLKPLSVSSGKEPEPSDPLKLAFAKAAAYKKSKGLIQSPDQNPTAGESGSKAPDSGKLAMEKAREYNINKGVSDVSIEGPTDSGQVRSSASNIKEGLVENKMNKKEELKISSTDFLGFAFSEKKRYKGMPPGLAPPTESLSEGDLPEVEFIVGDASKFGVAIPNTNLDKGSDNIDLYKPKVSTWGVFPRPNDISKTFGGGRVIRPGEVLETDKDKAIKEKRSRELIAAYKSKMGLSIDAKTRAECEKALKEGDRLMDLGKLREALPFYEKVMKDIIFQSELHGLAALQWSICQDSLQRSNEARVMYEKLQSHPVGKVSKRARQFVYSFKAMEMMKVRSSSYSRKTGYENYFDAFLENKVEYTTKEVEEDEGTWRKVLPYIILFVSPIFIVFLIAARKSFHF